MKFRIAMISPPGAQGTSAFSVLELNHKILRIASEVWPGTCGHNLGCALRPFLSVAMRESSRLDTGRATPWDTTSPPPRKRFVHPPPPCGGSRNGNGAPTAGAKAIRGSSNQGGPLTGSWSAMVVVSADESSCAPIAYVTLRSQARHVVKHRDNLVAYFEFRQVWKFTITIQNVPIFTIENTSGNGFAFFAPGTLFLTIG